MQEPRLMILAELTVPQTSRELRVALHAARASGPMQISPATFGGEI